MLISVCQGTFNGAHAFQGTAIQIANFIQMKGACVCRFCFRGLFVRSFAVAAMLLQRAAKGALLPSFAVIVCAWVRLCALARCLRLFFAVCAAFMLLQYICPPCTLYRVYVACIAAAFVAAYFVLHPCGYSTPRMGKY